MDIRTESLTIGEEYRICIQNKEMQERVDWVSRLFPAFLCFEYRFFNRNHKHSFGGLRSDILTLFLYISRIFCTLTCASTLLLFIVTISTKSQIFWKIRGNPSLFHKYLTVSMEWVDSSTLWVTSQKDRIRCYYGDFSPNYFEYRLSTN
jgi:hypothetical protein